MLLQQRSEATPEGAEGMVFRVRGPRQRKDRLALYRGCPQSRCMGNDPAGPLHYQRARFSALLPRDRLYTPTHCWALKGDTGTWRVGFTKFGSRLLGEVVDFGFEVAPGAAVSAGEKIGWLEGFKAVSELVCFVEGRFLGGNPALEQNPSLVNQDPHGAGWLYGIQGAPTEACVGVEAYARTLDQEIDRRLRELG